MKKWGKRSLSTLCVLTLGASVAAGCASNSGTASSSEAPAGSGTPQAAAKQEPLKLSMMSILYEPEPPKADGEATKKIEEYTNTKLEMNWVPSSSYDDKVNVTIASGELPKSILITNTKDPSVINSIRAGQFWEVGPYLKNYPNLAKINEIALNNISVDGKIYGLLRDRPLVRYGTIFRKDWLDKLGLKEPATIDEYYNVIKAFARNDPDGNGKADTYGFADSSSFAKGSMNFISAAFGAPNEWEVKDGKFIPAFATPQYLDALKFMKKLHDEKLMNSDFAALKDVKFTELFNQGKAGMYANVIENAVGGAVEALYKLDPNAKVDIITNLKTADGKERMFAQNGFFGVFMFPKSSVKTEAELKRILEFYNKLGDQQMQDLFAFGIEGKHYKKEDGKSVITNNNLLASEIVPLRNIDIFNQTYASPGKLPPLEEKIAQLRQSKKSIVVGNPAAPLISQTQSERGGELNKIIDDARIKFVMGVIDEAGYKAELDKWNKAGGDKVLQELGEAYAKIKK